MLSLHVLGPLAPKNTSTGAYLRAFQGLCKAQPRAPEYRVPNEIPTLRKRPDVGQILLESNQGGYADRKYSSPRWVRIRISVAVVGESCLLRLLHLCCTSVRPNWRLIPSLHIPQITARIDSFRIAVRAFHFFAVPSQFKPSRKRIVRKCFANLGVRKGSL